MKIARGFTLIEMAIAIFIIALLLGSLLIPLATQVEQKQISDTQRSLEEIREALIGFALANSRLPCPDRTTGVGANDGLEDVDGANRCVGVAGGIATGNVPWSTLGVAPSDPWGNRFRYVINESFARGDMLFSLTTPGTNVRVCETAACAATLSTTAVAAILSHGKNGYGAINSLGVQNPTPATNLGEIENADTDRDVVSRVRSGSEHPDGEFDDIVTWLSRYVLLNRMVMANKLP